MQVRILLSLLLGQEISVVMDEWCEKWLTSYDDIVIHRVVVFEGRLFFH